MSPRGWFAQMLIMWRRVWSRLKMVLLRPAFRRAGRHFIFDPEGHYTFENVEVGDDVTISHDCLFLATRSRIVIGNKAMIGPGVMIIGGNHNTAVPGRFMYDVRDKKPEDDQDVTIEDDVWVGARAIILKGVKLGRGSIVAAGAVVNKDVSPYTVVGGVPARVLSRRFDLETVLPARGGALSAGSPPEPRDPAERCRTMATVARRPTGSDATEERDACPRSVGLDYDDQAASADVGSPPTTDGRYGGLLPSDVGLLAARAGGPLFRADQLAEPSFGRQRKRQRLEHPICAARLCALCPRRAAPSP